MVESTVPASSYLFMYRNTVSALRRITYGMLAKLTGTNTQAGRREKGSKLLRTVNLALITIKYKNSYWTGT
jgi:hypothetical protein